VESGATFKLWIDDHFLIHAQNAAANSSVVGYYPLVLSAAGVLLRAEFAVIGANAVAQLAWGASADGPWAVVPAAALSPAVAPAEDAYQERRSAEDAGWSTWDCRDCSRPCSSRQASHSRSPSSTRARRRRRAM